MNANQPLIINFPMNYVLKPVEFVPSNFGPWEWSDRENGKMPSDGWLPFDQRVTVAMSIDNDSDATEFLFPRCSEAETGHQRIDRLVDYVLPHPDLGLALVEEKKQKMLNFLRFKFGVTSIEFLKRTIEDKHGRKASFHVSYDDPNRRWVYGYYDLDVVRQNNDHALVIGSW